MDSIYYPNDSMLSLKLERAQYLGIRTALGYRNSTPNNVITAEAKMRLLRDRAKMLAKNYLSKNVVYNNGTFANNLQELIRLENYTRFRQPLHKGNIITESWRKIKLIEKSLGVKRKHEVFDSNFRAITEKKEVDFEIGKERKKKKFSDAKLLNKIIGRHNLSENTLFMYTDESKNKKGKIN